MKSYEKKPFMVNSFSFVSLSFPKKKKTKHNPRWKWHVHLPKIPPPSCHISPDTRNGSLFSVTSNTNCTALWKHFSNEPDLLLTVVHLAPVSWGRQQVILGKRKRLASNKPNRLLEASWGVDFRDSSGPTSLPLYNSVRIKLPTSSGDLRRECTCHAVGTVKGIW